ncbi:MAG: type II secretion system protein [bacterium]|nr:type II secretion system protein [bacterium]
MAGLNSRGLTVVEVLVAMALVGIAAGGIMSAFLTQLQSNTLSESRSSAISAAEMELEALRMLDPATLPTSGSSSPKLVAIGDHAYAVTTHYCERTDLCASSTARYVRVEVRDSQGTRAYDVEVVFTQLH